MKGGLLGALLVAGAGFFAGWLVWGRQEPPPPAKPGVEYHYDTTWRRDTTNFVPPAVTAQLKALRGAIAGFLADTARKPDSACIALLAQAGIALDSLKQALATRPAVRLTLADSLKLRWPIVALWDTVTYAATGDTAAIRWGYGFRYAPPPPRGRLGAVFGYGAGAGGFGGLQIRFDQGKALQVAKTEKGWLGALVWFVK